MEKELCGKKVYNCSHLFPSRAYSALVIRKHDNVARI